VRRPSGAATAATALSVSPITTSDKRLSFELSTAETLIFAAETAMSLVGMFISREDAGQRLGQQLKDEGVHSDLVVGLPRGGVVVAAAVAHALELPLDVVIVRKIGHPLHREFAVGALAENGVVLLDEKALGRNPLIRVPLNEIIKEETQRLRDYQAKFHRELIADLGGKSVLVVDDGLATGWTTEAAVLSIRKQGARSIIVAVPVASTNAIERLRKAADDVRALLVDPEFDAVGRYYDSFSQTTDEEVLELLHHHSHSSTQP
jgi:putative phosphoribosyl transferase